MLCVLLSVVLYQMFTISLETEFVLRFVFRDLINCYLTRNLEETFQVEELEDYHGFDYDLQQARKIEKRLHFEQQWKRHVNFSK